MHRFLGLLAIAALIATEAAWAEEYAARPVTIIVPYVAGGPTDVLARSSIGNG